MTYSSHIPPLLTMSRPLLQAVIDAGGIPYLVGGAVRDCVMDRNPLDIDIEVHGIAPEALETVLSSFGPVSFIGKQFGVYKLHGNDIDWSLPRTDSKGRKPLVEIDPFIGIEKALQRRDVTMNAMAIDLRPFAESGILLSEDHNELCDPFEGAQAIREKRLTAVDTALFIEDPLRFYRVMQFAARFDMVPDEQLSRLCARMVLDSNDISAERIWAELEKMLLLAPAPALGFRWVHRVGRIKELFPELGNCLETPQVAKYHPEGNVFEHSLQALDAAAHLLSGRENNKKKTILLLAALCHDFGKVVSTTSDLSAKGHELTGVALAETFVKRFTHDADIIVAVKKLVRYHLEPRLMLAAGADAYHYKKLASLSSPEVTLPELAVIWLADQRGRNGMGSEPLTVLENEYHAFLHTVAHHGLTEGPEKPVLMGRDLVPLLGAGEHLGPLLAYAYDYQMKTGEKERAVLLNLACEQHAQKGR